VNYADPFRLCYGPLEAVCARAAVFFLGRVFPAIARFNGALTGLSAAGGGPPVGRVVENTRAAATISRWTAVFEGTFDKFNDMHLDAAARELAGEVVHWDVGKGRPSDHVLEVQNAISGMRNVASAMKRLLEQGAPTESQRAAAEALRQQAIEAIQRAREAGVTVGRR
jgi:putative RNase toxin 28 of polymorphic toxin system